MELTNMPTESLFHEISFPQISASSKQADREYSNLTGSRIGSCC